VQGPSRLVLAAFLVIVFIAGANVIVVQYSNMELPPFWGAAFRFLIAGVLLTVTALLMKLPLPQGKAWIGVGMYGLLTFGVSYAYAYWALLGLSAGVFAVLIALVPLLTFFLAWAHGLERFRWRGLAAALVVVVGIGLILGEQFSLNVPVQFLIGGLLTPVAMAESGIAAKLLRTSHPVTTGTFLLGFSRLVGEPWDLPREPRTIASVVHLVLLGSIAMFGLFLYVIKRWSVSAVSYQFVLTPLVAIALAWLMLGQGVTWRFAVGALIVLGGVVVALRAPGRPTPPTAAAAPQSGASTTDEPRP
jgi:drug/metabolite transporter (DMT)-like permease